MFDENDGIGGTWLVNSYPGCACDIQSHLYSFSFELNPGMSRDTLNEGFMVYAFQIGPNRTLPSRKSGSISMELLINIIFVRIFN